MQPLWCWRCREIVPMLDDAEFEKVVSAKSRHHGGGIRDGLNAALEVFNELTGANETNVNAIWHHCLSMYGPRCQSCGKPLRTLQAKLCGSCMTPVGPPD
jgi:hypothetical protein